MTDPLQYLAGPPRFLPPELVDLLRAVLRDDTDAARRALLRKWGEACFDAGFALGMEDPTPDGDRRQTEIGLRPTTYTTGSVATRRPTPAKVSDAPVYDALSDGSRTPGSS